MELRDRALLGGVAVAIPSGIVAALFVPAEDFLSALAMPMAGMLLGAGLVMLRVQPFRWLEEKFRSDSTE